MRKLRVLIQHLPPNSALHRAIHGHDWTEAWMWLLADIRDGVVTHAVRTGNRDRKKGATAAPAPKPAWRPEVSEEVTEYLNRSSEDGSAEVAQVELELRATADRIFTTPSRR